MLYAVNNWVYTKYSKLNGGKIFMNKDEKVCYCFNVTVGDIENAINEGADSLGAVQQATKAGAGCGRCSANVEKVTLELLKENK